MTIQFNCPNCNDLIAFADKHSGKRARCSTCGQILIIPSRDSETPKKIKPQIEKAEPLPGFYHAVFVDSWKIFLTRTNVTGLIFIALLVCFMFFVRHMNYTVIIHGRSLTFYFPVPFGSVMTITAWGCLFWYYMQFIYSSAFGTDQLPGFHPVSIAGFLWNILKTIYTVFIVLLVLGLPCLIALLITKEMGISSPVLLWALMLCGLFVFPAAMLNVAVGKDLTMLRPDYILIPVFRAFKPYLVVAALLITFGVLVLEMQTKQFAGLAKETFLSTTGKSILNLAVQVIAIIAMRSIGLFYRHYNCYLPW